MAVPPGEANHVRPDLTDVLPTAYHSVVDTRVDPDDVVAVWG